MATFHFVANINVNSYFFVWDTFDESFEKVHKKNIRKNPKKALKDVAIWWTLLAPILSISYSLKDSKTS